MKECFVIMPIGEGDRYYKYLNIYEKIIFKAVNKYKYGDLYVFNAIRADFISKSGSITKAIIEHINNADLVVADLTDLNPNVFYELGMRHSRRNGTILIAIDGTKLPFDTGYLNTVFYKDIVGGERKAIRDIQLLIDNFVKNGFIDSPFFEVFPTLAGNCEITSSWAGSIDDNFLLQKENIDILFKDGHTFFSEESKLNLLKQRFAMKDYKTRIMIVHPNSRYMDAVASMDSTKRNNSRLQRIDCLKAVKTMHKIREELIIHGFDCVKNVEFYGHEMIPTWNGYISEGEAIINLYTTFPYRGNLPTLKVTKDHSLYRNYRNDYAQVVRSVIDEVDCCDLWDYVLPAF